MNSELALQNPVAGTAEFLLPEQALDRFTAPPDILWSGAQEARERKRYGYRIGRMHFLIAADTGSEVLRLPAISSMPGAAHHLLGMTNLRGNLLPVFDLAQLLGNQESSVQGSRHAPIAQYVLVLDKGDLAVGIVIDGFPQALLGLTSILRMPQLPAQLQAHVSAAYFKEDSIWLDFQHQSFFAQLCTQ